MKILFFPILNILLAGCVQNKTVTDADIKQSRNLVEKSETVVQGSPKWFNILDSAILLNPKNASAYREKSVWYNKIGDYVKGYSLLNHAVELDSFDALGYRGWLRLYKLHDYEGAIDDLEAYDDLTPNVVDYVWSENLYYLTGLAKKQQGRDVDAIKDFNYYIDDAIRRNGSKKWVDIYTFVDKGICFRNLKQYDSSLYNFELALRYYSECPEAWYEKSITLSAMGSKRESCEALQKSLILAEAGRIRTDSYKDYFDQLYVEEIKERLPQCN